MYSMCVCGCPVQCPYTRKRNDERGTFTNINRSTHDTQTHTRITIRPSSTVRDVL